MVRHPVVARIVNAYEAWEAEQKQRALAVERKRANARTKMSQVILDLQLACEDNSVTGREPVSDMAECGDPAVSQEESEVTVCAGRYRRKPQSESDLSR